MAASIAAPTDVDATHYRYWWVNQNQTFRQEIDGGYMWSPKTRRDGARNEFYENMRRVEVGDIVFSFRKQVISHIGIAASIACDSEKPEEFDSTENKWLRSGWRVDVTWVPVPQIVKPKEMIGVLRPHLPTKYSPINPKTGDGYQSVYLASVPYKMADLLLTRLGIDRNNLDSMREEIIAGKDGKLIEEEVLERAIRAASDIGRTEKQALIIARVGQGTFRRNVESIEKGCRVTGITDKRLLRASHIKAWAKCGSNSERLDGENGLLLTPAVDHLFDSGLITFSVDGKLIASSTINRNDFEKLGIRDGAKVLFGEFSAGQKKYLSYHHRYRFQP